MVNEIRYKSLKCIEWSVQVTNCSSISSETFTLQNHKCSLQLNIGSYTGYDYNPSYLYFKSEIELPSPIIVTVRTDTTASSKTTESIKGGQGQIIWTSGTNTLSGCKLSFEVIIHADVSKDDKSSQISSYKDVCLLTDSLSNDFSKLFDEGLNYDVEFTCADHVIKAHKNILCSRSNVFASMLQSDMVEGNTGRINIKDVDAFIFKSFLICLYTGKLPELTVESAYQLYEVADKYNAHSIKKVCADFLTDNLSHENACDILLLADQHNDEYFKKNVMEYVIKEKILYVGQKWTDFCKENPVLAVEVYVLFCEQFRKK